MKILFTLSLCLFISLSHADFLSAQKDYKNGNFEKAYTEYLTLAQFGNNKAQYNLAVMLVKGQGVEVDLVQAYAWSKISEFDQSIKKLSETIKKDLSKTQLPKAQKLYDEYFGKYSFNNSKVILGPVVETNNVNQTNIDYQIIADKNYAPEYPRKQLMNGIQGWVDLNFRIHPDGSVRDIYVTDEMPPNSFAKAAIRSVLKYRYSFENNGQKLMIDEPRFATQRIEFKIGKVGSGQIADGFNKKQQNQLDELIKKAENGDIDAQYNYAYLYDTLLHKKGQIDGKKINQWLFNAAIDGITGAQYRLGQNIYYGNNCKVEKQKGLDWIMQAAHIGNADAQYMAYSLLKNKSAINQSNSSPFYWLTQSAKNGLNIAQLHYAKEIALLDSPTTEQIGIAKKYLANYSSSIFKTTQWHQINAMVLNKTNKNKKAIKSVEKAIKSAKRLGWDLTELEQLKTTIMNNKT